jgi:hypothetical protein
VVTDRQLRPDIPGWDRRRRQDLGTFITREEIEQSRALVASEVLRRVPSVQLIPRGGGLLGNDVLIRGCRPLLIVDGAPIAGTRGEVLPSTSSSGPRVWRHWRSTLPPTSRQNLASAATPVAQLLSGRGDPHSVSKATALGHRGSGSASQEGSSLPCS